MLVVLNGHTFHLVSLLELLREIKVLPSEVKLAIYYGYGNEKSIGKYVELIGEYGFDDFQLWKLNKTSNPVLLLFYKLSVSKKILSWFKQRHCHYLIMGNYLSEINTNVLNHIAYEQLFFLDEGTSTINVAKKRSNSEGLRSFGLTLLFKILFRFRLDAPEKATFFTAYSQLSFGKNDSVIPVTYRNLQEVSKHKTIEENYVLFLGNPFVYYKYVSESFYFDYLKLIAKYFKQQGKRIEYYPHRMETASNLEKVRLSGFDVLPNSEPIELFILRSTKIPENISSFITSAFYTLDNILPERVKMFSFYIKKEEFLIRSDFWSEQYLEFKRGLNRTIDVVHFNKFDLAKID